MSFERLEIPIIPNDEDENIVKPIPNFPGEGRNERLIFVKSQKRKNERLVKQRTSKIRTGLSIRNSF